MGVVTDALSRDALVPLALEVVENIEVLGVSTLGPMPLVRVALWEAKLVSELAGLLGFATMIWMEPSRSVASAILILALLSRVARRVLALLWVDRTVGTSLALRTLILGSGVRDLRTVFMVLVLVMPLA